MTKIITRISTGKYNFIELEEELEKNISIEVLNSIILKYKEITNKHTQDSSPKSPEVVWSKDKCPDCGGLLIESIGISPKNNKPYHYIKCIQNKDKNSMCSYIKWIEVSAIPETIEIKEDFHPNGNVISRTDY